MLAQYTSPLIIALLLRLARFRAAHPHLRFGLRGGGASVKGGGEGLVRLAEGWGRAAGSVADARVIMRAFGGSRVMEHRSSSLSTFKLYELFGAENQDESM
jgi:hypothetical protein